MVDDDDNHNDDSVPDFEGIARDIQNRAPRRVGTSTTERRLFREFFGTSLRVVIHLWELVVCNRLKPRGGT
jgi:hypothetical protein